MVNKLVTTLIIGTTLIGMNVGTIEVLAQEASSSVVSISNNIKFEDIRTTIDIEPIIGKDSHQHNMEFDGEYTLYKTHDMVVDGSTIELSEPKLIGKYTGNKEVVGLDAGEYTLLNTKPSTGFLVDREEYRYSLPIMEGGVILENQYVNFKPKLTPVDLSVEFTKKSEDGTLMEGVTFEFGRVEEYLEEFITDELGVINLEGLTTGEYVLREKETLEGYMLDSREIKVTIGYTEDGEPNIKMDYGSRKYVIGNEKEGTLEMTNFYQPHFVRGSDSAGADGEEVSDDDFIGLGGIGNNGGIGKDGKMGEGSIETEIRTTVLGDVLFVFRTGLPTNIEEYEEFVIMNIFSEIMKEKGEPRLLLDNKEELIKGEDYKVTLEGKELTINLTEEGIAKAEGKKTLTVEQASVVDLDSLEDKVLAEKETKNEVILEVDNGSGNIVSFSDEVTIIFKEGAVQLSKIDGNNIKKSIEGAKFRLERLIDGKYEPVKVNERYIQINKSNETYIEEDGVVHLVTGKDGLASIHGLEFGEYRLVEVEAPKGYEVGKEPIEFEVDDVEVGDRAIKDVEDSVGVEVENFAIKEYPKTGTWNNVMIVVLMVSGVASVVYIQTKKEVKEEELEGK